MAGNEGYDPPEVGESSDNERKESEPTDGDERGDLGVDMEGFQTGAGLDLEGSPREESPDSDLGVLVTRVNTFDEFDLVSDSTEPMEGLDVRGWDAEAQAGDAKE